MKRYPARERVIGARIRQARVQRGLSQTALADRLDLSFQQIQKYELGKDRVAASSLIEIAAVLDQPAAWFFEDVAAEEAKAGAHDRRCQDPRGLERRRRIAPRLEPDGPAPLAGLGRGGRCIGRRLARADRCGSPLALQLHSLLAPEIASSDRCHAQAARSFGRTRRK